MFSDKESYSFIVFSKVLPILIRDIGVNFKEGEDIALVRFDSYADLLTPKKVKADEIQTLDHLVEYVEGLFSLVLNENFVCIGQLLINVGSFLLFTGVI